MNMKLSFIRDSVGEKAIEANISGKVQTKRHPISRKSEQTLKKNKVKTNKKSEKSVEEGDKNLVESSEDSDNDKYGGSTEDECSDSTEDKQKSDDSDSKQKIDVYLKDVSKKKETVKKNGPPSFQAAFESLVAVRSGALALRPGSVVEEMPPRRNKPKKRKADGVAVQNTEIKHEGIQVKQEAPQTSSNPSNENTNNASLIPIKSEKVTPKATVMDTAKQVIPKKRSRKENPGTSSYSFLPLAQSNMTTQQQNQSDFNRINFLMPTIRWIEQQQMLQNNTKGKSYIDSPFNQSSGISFGDLLSSTAKQPSRDSSCGKQENRESGSFSGMDVPKSLTVVTPTSQQGTADYIKTVRMKSIPSATVTSEPKQEGSQALDLSYSSAANSELSTTVNRTVHERNAVVSETSDSRTLEPKPPDILHKPPMKLTGTQQSLCSNMSEAFKLANSMLTQKPETSPPGSKPPRSLLSPGRHRVEGTMGLAEAVSHDHGSLGSPPLPSNACGSTTCIGTSSSLLMNSPSMPSHSNMRPPQAHMIRPSNPNPRFPHLNPIVSSTAQSNLLLQALNQQNPTSLQQQNFLANIPVMHSGTTTGCSTSITPTSTITNASQVKQIVYTKGVILNSVKTSGSGTVAPSKPTVSQLLKATRGVANSESKSQTSKNISNNNTKYVQMKSPSGTVSLVPVVSHSRSGGNTILLQNPPKSNVLQIVSTSIANTATGNILVQPTSIQKLSNPLMQQTVTNPLRIAVSPQVVPNSTLCIVPQSKPLNTVNQQKNLALAGNPQATVVASTPIIGQKAASVPQFGGRPQFSGTTQFLLQGVAQIHPSPTAFQVDPKTPHFQTIVTSNQVSSPQSCTIVGSLQTQPITNVAIKSPMTSEAVNPGTVTKFNGATLSGLNSDVDQAYGAIVSPNKVLQLVPQPIVPISQVSAVTTLTTTTSTTPKHKMSTESSQEMVLSKVLKKDSDSNNLPDAGLENKVKAGLLSPSSNQSLYRMSSPGSVDKTLVQVSSYSAFSGNHPNKISPDKCDTSGSSGEISPSKVGFMHCEVKRFCLSSCRLKFNMCAIFCIDVLYCHFFRQQKRNPVQQHPPDLRILMENL